MSQLLWAGKALGILTSGLALMKLVSQFLAVGLVGIPELIVTVYADFVDAVYRALLEVPFDIVLPEWLKHGAIVWTVFAGSNWRFLTAAGHGERLITGVGDVGRGTRRGSLSQPQLYAIYLGLALVGPLFAVFVLMMWLGNRRPGPSGLGRCGDRLMIGNRLYSVRISGIYLATLAMAPLSALVFLLWNGFS